MPPTKALMGCLQHKIECVNLEDAVLQFTMITTPLPSLTIIITLAFLSCNRATPAGFWKSYQKNFLVKNISDQGPWGGYRAIYWKTDKTKTFNSSNVLAFARKNGWFLLDSSDFSEEQINKWTTYDNKAVFPLTSIGFTDTVFHSTQLEKFPRWFNGPIRLYKFTTGFITIEPGTDESIEENGFVLINEYKTEMSVYHLWGE